MLDRLHDFIKELEVKSIICFGSTTTGKKKGLSKAVDIDVIIVSDYFHSMSKFRRQRIVADKLGERVDSIPLTTQEYGSLRKKKGSVVNIALKEGRKLCLF